MNKPIRVLHVIGYMNRGGAETMLMNLYRNIDRTKIQFDFVQNEGEPAAFDAEITELGGRIYHCPRYHGKNHFSYTSWWKRFFKEHKGEYRIIHGHIGSTAAIYLSIAKSYGLYTIVHSHSAGGGSAIYRLFSFPTRYIANHFFACSHEAAISRYGKKVNDDPERCQILNNAIETNRFVYSAETRNKIREMWNIPMSSIVIGHVGRFVEVKNHIFLLQIFNEIKKKNKDVLLLLVGDGELRPQIENKIHEINLQDSVILTGVQSNVCDFLQAMDIFVMPSLYEGLPVSMVEAQAAGLPCVVSNRVPQETNISGLVDFVSLETSFEQWALTILNRAKGSRKDMRDIIINAGYDITETSKWLADYYLHVVTKND